MPTGPIRKHNYSNIYIYVDDIPFLLHPAAVDDENTVIYGNRGFSNVGGKYYLPCTSLRFTEYQRLFLTGQRRV